MLRLNAELSEYDWNQKHAAQTNDCKEQAEDFCAVQQPEFFLAGFFEPAAPQVLADDYAGCRANSAECHEKQIGDCKARRHSRNYVRATPAVVKGCGNGLGDCPDHFRAHYHPCLFEDFFEKAEIHPEQIEEFYHKGRAFFYHVENEGRHFNKSGYDGSDCRALNFKALKAHKIQPRA